MFLRIDEEIRVDRCRHLNPFDYHCVDVAQHSLRTTEMIGVAERGVPIKSASEMESNEELQEIEAGSCHCIMSASGRARPRLQTAFRPTESDQATKKVKRADRAQPGVGKAFWRPEAGPGLGLLS